MKVLILIPARKGSKGLPGKNKKLLGSKPLIAYSIEFALSIKGEEDVICVSSNDEDVFQIAEKYNIQIPFKRPEQLASDRAGSYEVIIHSLQFYESSGIYFDAVLLLQPTSPFRLKEDYLSMVQKFSKEVDMVVTVKYARENPYFNLFEESNNGFLQKCKPSNFSRRQDCPPVFAFNGSMYLINTQSLKRTTMQGFTKIVKEIIPEERSIDIDTMNDWVVAEYLLSAK